MPRIRKKKVVNKELMKKIGQKGGQSTLTRYGSAHFSSASKARKHRRGGRPRKSEQDRLKELWAKNKPTPPEA
jgi:general stress protein YciG